MLPHAASACEYGTDPATVGYGFPAARAAGAWHQPSPDWTASQSEAHLTGDSAGQIPRLNGDRERLYSLRRVALKEEL
jgi:hypothetical protein